MVNHKNDDGGKVETRIAKISTKDASNFIIFRDRVMRKWPISVDETLDKDTLFVGDSKNPFDLRSYELDSLAIA